MDKLVNPNSSTLYEDKKEILNFLLHTENLSHISKDFYISYKWTYLLMEEFWTQEDLEKSLEIPVSFLCGRETSKVPQSQIGFITGFVLPIFDTLIHNVPSLKYF